MLLVVFAADKFSLPLGAVKLPLIAIVLAESNVFAFADDHVIGAWKRRVALPPVTWKV